MKHIYPEVALEPSRGEGSNGASLHRRSGNAGLAPFTTVTVTFITLCFVFSFL